MTVLKKYGLSLLVTVIILVLCFMNPPEIPVEIPMTNFDKLVHCLMFMGLSGIVFFDNSVRLKQKVTGWVIFGSSFLFPAVFGGGIEIGQKYMTATRTGDWMDFLFDAIGSFCGCIICLIINRRLNPVAEANAN